MIRRIRSIVDNVFGLAASLMRDGLTVFVDQNRGADEEKIP